jgi:hypothetical protein
MKLGKFGIVAAAFALVLCFEPNVGWSTRAYGAMVSGEITARPSSGQIEIAHHLYHVKPQSFADKSLSSFYAGQSVDAVLDGPLGSSASQVVSIMVHKG